MESASRVSRVRQGALYDMKEALVIYGGGLLTLILIIIILIILF
jgi:hypothetical protein